MDFFHLGEMHNYFITYFDVNWCQILMDFI